MDICVSQELQLPIYPTGLFVSSIFQYTMYIRETHTVEHNIMSQWHTCGSTTKYLLQIQGLLTLLSNLKTLIEAVTIKFIILSILDSHKKQQQHLRFISKPHSGFENKYISPSIPTAPQQIQHNLTKTYLCTTLQQNLVRNMKCILIPLANFSKGQQRLFFAPQAIQLYRKN